MTSAYIGLCCPKITTNGKIEITEMNTKQYIKHPTNSTRFAKTVDNRLYPKY